jgi:hypothetical protein
MSNKEDLLLLCLSNNIINNGWEVVYATFMITIVPEVWTVTARLKGGVVTRIGVASGVHQPNIIAWKHKGLCQTFIIVGITFKVPKSANISPIEL